MNVRVDETREENEIAEVLQFSGSRNFIPVVDSADLFSGHKQGRGLEPTGSQNAG